MTNRVQKLCWAHVSAAATAMKINTVEYSLVIINLSKDRVVQKDKPVGVLPTKSTYTPEITKTMT